MAKISNPIIKDVHRARERIRELEQLLDNAKREMVSMSQIEALQHELRRAYDFCKQQGYDPHYEDGELAMSKPNVDYRIAPANSYHHNASSATKYCPHCSNNNQTFLGNLIIDGTPRPAYACMSCNHSWSDLPDGVKVLLDVAREQGAISVGFAPASNPAEPVIQNATVSNSYDYEEQQRLGREETRKANDSSALATMTSTMQQMLYALQNLTHRLDQVTQQNSELMDKIANDPLVHIRKAITEFDLR